MEGWEGWDEYAPFYDWENARTLGRRDVAFWRKLARRNGGPTLELGCGTGRVSIPLARAGIRVVGIDRSAAMLDRARVRARRARLDGRLTLVRGDIREMPFAGSAFSLVMAPYGLVQSLVSDADLTAALKSVARVTRRGATFAMDLVPDLPVWNEYKRRVRLRGRLGGRGRHVTLIESVHQQRARGLTVFDEEFVETRGTGRRTNRFSLVFRTVSIAEMTRRLSETGFDVEAVLGDYAGGPWDPRADVWMILAVRK